MSLMPVHTIRIESTSPQNAIELQSVATWARGPGRTVSFSAERLIGGTARMDVDDRVARLERADQGSGVLRATLQVATAEDRLTLRVHMAASGVLSITSEGDRWVSSGKVQPEDTTTLVLFLGPTESRRT